MNVRFFMMMLLVVFFAVACNESNKNVSQSDTGNKINVTEVLQTSNYTYLKSGENDTEQWYALPKMEAVKGDVYYFSGGQMMIDFESAELKRTFDKVMFLEGVSKEPIEKKHSHNHNTDHATIDNNNMDHHSEKPKIEQKEVTVEAAEGCITIAELFSNKKEYEGKVVKIKAEVIKFNPAIMKKNWIHLQDGTKHNDQFDLTITSDQEFEVGKVVTIQGKVVLDKDFGFGYFYHILLEESKILE